MRSLHLQQAVQRLVQPKAADFQLGSHRNTILEAQATAAADWWSRLGSTDPLNHAYQWGWYLLHPTLAQRQDAVAAELEVCRFWLNQTLDCLLKVERAHEGLLGSRSAYSAKYRGGKVGAWAARACCPTTSGWWRRRRVLVTGTATSTGPGMPRAQRLCSARQRPSLSEGEEIASRRE